MGTDIVRCLEAGNSLLSFFNRKEKQIYQLRGRMGKNYWKFLEKGRAMESSAGTEAGTRLMKGADRKYFSFAVSLPAGKQPSKQVGRRGGRCRRAAEPRAVACSLM